MREPSFLVAKSGFASSFPGKQPTFLLSSGKRSKTPLFVSGPRGKKRKSGVSSLSPPPAGGERAYPVCWEEKTRLPLPFFCRGGTLGGGLPPERGFRPPPKNRGAPCAGEEKRPRSIALFFFLFFLGRGEEGTFARTKGGPLFFGGGGKALG